MRDLLGVDIHHRIGKGWRQLFVALNSPSAERFNVSPPYNLDTYASHLMDPNLREIKPNPTQANPRLEDWAETGNAIDALFEKWKTITNGMARSRDLCKDVRQLQKRFPNYLLYKTHPDEFLDLISVSYRAKNMFKRRGI